MFEGNDKMIGYIGVIDALTIDEITNLEGKSKQLIMKASEVSQALAEINEVKKHLGLI